MTIKNHGEKEKAYFPEEEAIGIQQTSSDPSENGVATQKSEGVFTQAQPENVFIEKHAESRRQDIHSVRQSQGQDS